MLLVRNYLTLFLVILLSLPAYCSYPDDPKKDIDRRGQEEPMSQSEPKRSKVDDDSPELGYDPFDDEPLEVLRPKSQARAKKRVLDDSPEKRGSAGSEAVKKAKEEGPVTEWIIKEARSSAEAIVQKHSDDGQPAHLQVVVINQTSKLLLKYRNDEMGRLRDSLLSINADCLYFILEIEEYLTRGQLDVMLGMLQHIIEDGWDTEHLRTHLLGAKLKEYLQGHSEQQITKAFNWIAPISCMLIHQIDLLGRILRTETGRLDNLIHVCQLITAKFQNMHRVEEEHYGGRSAYHNLVRTLLNCPNDKIEFFCALVRNLEGDNLDSDFLNLVDKLSELTQEQMNFVFENAERLCREKMVPANLWSLTVIGLSNVAKHPQKGDPDPTGVQQLAEYVQKLSNVTDVFFRELKERGPDVHHVPGSDYAHVIWVLSTLNSDKWESISRAALIILNHTMQADAKFYKSEGQIYVISPDIFGLLNQIDPDKFSFSVQSALEMTKELSWLSYDTAELACAASTVHPEQMDFLIRAAKENPRILNPEYVKFASMAIRTLGLLPAERMGEIRDFCDAVPGDKLYSRLNRAIMESIPFLPSEQASPFVRDLSQLSVEEQAVPRQYLCWKLSLMQHAKDMQRQGPAHYQQLLEHWRILMDQHNTYRANIICKFLVKRMEELNLNEDHSLFQLALRTLAIMNSKSPRNPYVVYARLKEKKMVPMNWDELPEMMCRDGSRTFRYNYQGMASYGNSMVVDVESCPAYGISEFVQLLGGLKQKLEANNELCMQMGKLAHMMRMSEQEDNADESNPHTLQRWGNELVEVLDRHGDSSSHLSKLLSGKTDILDACKLRCVLSYLTHLPDETDRVERLCRFLAFVRNCDLNQNNAIQLSYMELPRECRMRANRDIAQTDEAELPALRALYEAVQSVILSHFSAESMFVRLACEAQVDEDIEQTAHQTDYLKSAAGDLVGLPDATKFDVNGQVIEPSLLKMSRSEMIHLYYKHFSLDHLLKSVKTALDSQICEQNVSGKHTLYPSLICVQRNKFPHVSMESWTEVMYENDDDWAGRTTGVTPLCVMQMMTREGLLDEIIQ
jgi:hypothetical protein